MNVALFKEQLAIALGQTSTTVFSPPLIQTVLCLAVRAYRRYRQLERQFGTGHLYVDGIATQTTVEVVGGPWVVGSQVTINDSYNTETLTLQSFGAGAQLDNWMGYPFALTFTTPLQFSHGAGVWVGAVTPGLQVNPSQANYLLPPDFVDFEDRTFDLANGSRYWIKRYESFYDGAYRMSDLLSGVGWGQSQTFNSFNGFGGGGFAAFPNATGALSVPLNGAFNQQAYDVMPGNPPQLLMTPAPQSSQFWQFNYFGTHQPETVPDEDFDALMDAAMASAMYAIQNNLAATLLDLKDDDQTESPSANVRALQMIADQSMDRFMNKIQRRPFVITG